MRAIAIVLGLLAAGLGLAAQQPQGSEFVGRWNIKATGEHARQIYWLEVVQKDGVLHGMFLDRSAHATPVAWIRVEGNELVWQKGAGEGLLDAEGNRERVRQCGPIYRARLQNGKLVGSHTLPAPPCEPNPNAGRGRGGRGAGGGQPAAAAAPAQPKQTVNWVGERQPIWPYSNANGLHTYGQPVVIVGPGKGIEQWTGFTEDTWQTPCENRWTFDGGMMKNAVPAQGERPTCNVYTKERFKDFRVDAELMLDQGQNSGFYIRGRYELQLSLGQIGGATAGRQSLGSIYGWATPDFYAGKPAGQWQKLEAIVVGNRITVWLNDIRIHNNEELFAFTGGALDNDEQAPGPIMLQGDHSLVTLRKIVVTPITKAGQ